MWRKEAEQKRREGTRCFCLQPGALTLHLVVWPCSLWVGLAGTFRDLSDVAPSLHELTGSTACSTAQVTQVTQPLVLNERPGLLSSSLAQGVFHPSVHRYHRCGLKLLISIFLAWFMLHLEQQPKSHQHPFIFFPFLDTPPIQRKP